LPYGPGFSQFAFRNTGPHELTAADVTVRISNDDFIFPERVNVQFTFGTPTAATQAGDVFIDYRVDMQDQSSINRVGARFVGSVPSQGAGSGSVFLTQTISTLNGEDLTVLSPVSDRESLVLSNDGPGRSDDVNSQFILLNPTYALRLSAQISLAAREDGRFDVAFSDQFSFIPEPAATTVVIPGIFLLMRRRRQVASVRPTPVA